MIDLMTDLESKGGEKNKEYFNSLARYVAVKEDHAEKAKAEIRVIWGDYLKAQQLEKYPDTHALVHKIMLLGSKCRQTVDRDAALQFVEAINGSQIWETKASPPRQGHPCIGAGASFIMLRLLKVTGNSLYPEYEQGDFVVVSKIPFFFAPARPGDVVAFRQPGYGLLIKLVESVDAARGELTVAGTQPDSVDSRLFGPVPKKALVGKVIWHVSKPK
jgi:hypothetical protein